MKSSYSGAQGGNCIDISVDSTNKDRLLICETKLPVTVVTTTKENFAAFIQGVKAGEFDHFAE